MRKDIGVEGREASPYSRYGQMAWREGRWRAPAKAAWRQQRAGQADGAARKDREY